MKASEQVDVFRAAYPTVSELLEGTPFEADATVASEFAKSKEDMKSALMGRAFALNELMWVLCGAVFPEWVNTDAAELESDLAAVVRNVGIIAARTAYKEKFLVEARSRIQDPKTKLLDAKNKFQDVRYEIAVTARACAVLDSGSIQLEKPISDPDKDEKDWKNSDVFGTFHGKPVRIEVTVLHESLPPAIHIELDDLLRQAHVSSGFRIVLRSVLIDQDYAQRVRALLELLHESHISSGGTSVDIDSVRFDWKGGAYHCMQTTSPFQSICFYSASEFPGAEKLREIVHPASERAVTSRHVLEDHPNPPGVVTSADLPDAPTQVPVSTKVSQMLGGKRQQCVDGVINIVALGNPLPMHDREVVSAVRGSEFVGVQCWTDKNGVRHSGKGVLLRDTKAPFVPEQYLPNDDRIQFTEPFKKMSAIWHIRLGRYAKSRIISNPNASNPIPREIEEALSDPASPPCEATANTLSPESPDDNGQEEDIVWAEVAENFVGVCGSLSEARSVLARLEQNRLSLDELQKKVEHIWSGPQKENRSTPFSSPTDDEMAITFIVDCGGYEQAKACLDAYAEEIQGNASERE